VFCFLVFFGFHAVAFLPVALRHRTRMLLYPLAEARGFEQPVHPWHSVALTGCPVGRFPPYQALLPVSGETGNVLDPISKERGLRTPLLKVLLTVYHNIRYTVTMAKKKTSIRLSDTAQQLLEQLSERLGISQSAAIEQAIRALATREGISPVPSPK
jgi:Ribbon-helix-helix protein, copG family